MSKLIQLLERLTLLHKLALGFGSLLLLALVLGGQSLYVQTRLSHDFELLQSEEVVGVARAKEAETQLVRMILALHKAAGETDPVKRDAYLTQRDASRAQLRQATTQLRSTLVRAENVERLDEFEGLLAQLESDADDAAALMRRGLHEQAQSFIDEEFEHVARQAGQRMAAIADTKEKGADVASDRIRSFAAQQTMVSVGLLVGGLALVLLSSMAIALSIRRPAARVRAAVEGIAQGRLQEPVPHTDLDNEVGELARSVAALRDGLSRQGAELKAQQAELELTRAWYQGIVEAAPDGMLVIDATGRVLLTNPQLDELFGYAHGELIGQPMEVLVPPASRAQHPQLRAGFMAQGRSRQMGRAQSVLEGQ
ncbi:MAG TPA: MCP four helix bundle domain-containing protein, partial [Rhizobacter sp.]|nr:MCP four helix bundle domain-containing protein [Rhizobacter sp.]